MNTIEYNEVKSLEKEVNELSIKIEEKKKALNIAERNLQSVCEHNYYAEDNGDYHKPGWYYVCSICKHWTSHRPKNYQ